MKATTIGHVLDGGVFYLSKYSKVIYEVIKREKGWVLFTSMSSNKSFKRKGGTACWV